MNFCHCPNKLEDGERCECTPWDGDIALIDELFCDDEVPDYVFQD